MARDAPAVGQSSASFIASRDAPDEPGEFMLAAAATSDAQDGGECDDKPEDTAPGAHDDAPGDAPDGAHDDAPDDAPDADDGEYYEEHDDGFDHYDGYDDGNHGYEWSESFRAW